MAKLDEVSAKVAPALEKAKAESLPFWHSLRYCVVWLAWVVTLPVVVVGNVLADFGKKIKPELPPKA